MFGLESIGPIVLAVFALFIGILALLMPLFVMQIRDSNRRIVKWLEYISDQLPPAK